MSSPVVSAGCACWLLLALACGEHGSHDSTRRSSGGADSTSSSGAPSEGPGGASSAGGANGAEEPDGLGGGEESPDGASGETGASAGFDWKLPPGFPEPFVPIDKPMTAERVELGRYLFYDRRLSGNETQSCADCHHQDKAFTDGQNRAVGSTGETHPRSAQGLGNVAYYSVLTWANPLMVTLEKQVLLPLFGDAPVELGLAGRDDELLGRLRAVPVYRELFPAAFPERADPFQLVSVVDALACFQRILISGRSPYDAYTYGGDPNALTDAQRRGQSLFFSEEAECYHCHGGFNFTDNTRTALTTRVSTHFHNTALYNLDDRGAYPADSQGTIDVTGEPADMGKFRTPSLRNVELTAPYMHDGSVATLEEVVAHYVAGGRTISSGPSAGVGSSSPLRDALIRPMRLSSRQQADLVAFLTSLTDREFVTDPRFSNPWP